MTQTIHNNKPNHSWITWLVLIILLGLSKTTHSAYDCTIDSVLTNGKDKAYIMLLGDSITQGNNNFNYRKHLFDFLNGQGYAGQFKYVGSWSTLKTVKYDNDTNCNIKSIDESNGRYKDVMGKPLLKHEGHWGATTSWFANGIQHNGLEYENDVNFFKLLNTNEKSSINLYPNTSLESNSSGSGCERNSGLKILKNINSSNIPDIALIHLGTNDNRLYFNTSSTINNLKTIIGKLRAKNASVKILLAQIIPSNSSDLVDDNKIVELNNQIATQVFSSLQSPVCIVDHFSRFNSNLDSFYSSDRLHPNDTGSQQMAKIWFDALMGKKQTSIVGSMNDFGGNENSISKSDQVNELVQAAKTEIGSNIDPAGFDEGGLERPVGYTHTLTSEEIPIESAFLEFRFKSGINGFGDFHNDFLVIKGPFSTNAKREVVMLKDVVDNTTNLDGHGDITNANNKVYTAKIDLSKVPVRIRSQPNDWLGTNGVSETGNTNRHVSWDNLGSSKKAIRNWLPELSDGRLDVVISDDTMVDYSKLTVTYAINRDTPMGSNVVVSPHPNVYASFSSVFTQGQTTVVELDSQSVNASFKRGNHSSIVKYFDISTTADISGGKIKLSFNYSDYNFGGVPNVYHIDGNRNTTLLPEVSVDQTQKIITVEATSLSTFALVDPGSWNLICQPKQMEISGVGMGDRSAPVNPQTLDVADVDSVEAILAQVSGRHINQRHISTPSGVEFQTSSGESFNVSQPSLESPFGYSYITDLAPANQVTAKVFDPLGTHNRQTPRGMVLYTLRSSQQSWSSIGQVSNDYVWGGSSDEDVTVSKTFTFPALQQETDLYITLVVTDNDDDVRALVAEAQAGNVEVIDNIDVSTDGKLLNIVELVLPNVPGGTTEAVVTLRSPTGYGDSLLWSGVNVSYPCQSSARVTEGLQALYTFNEGNGAMVYDVSSSATPLNLSIGDTSAVSWLPSGGLSIEKPTIIKSSIPATQLNRSIKNSNELTVEAWVKPANNTQYGPARIVTLSEDISLRNVTLSQGLWLGRDVDVFDVRLRTTGTSLNGLFFNSNPLFPPSFSTSQGTATTELTHIVFVHEPFGLNRIYLNGEEVRTGRVPFGYSNWDENYYLALGNELTENRPWVGELHLVAIYNKALTKEEVMMNYSSGL